MSWLVSKFKNMVFSSGEDAQFKEFSQFQCEVRLFNLNKQTRSKNCIFVSGQLRFINYQDLEYSYDINIKNLQPSKSQSSDNEYFFPLQENMIIQQYSYQDENVEIIGYQWEIEDDILAIEFDNQINGDLSDAIEFQDNVCKLIYQTTYKQSYKQAKDSQLYEQFCIQKNNKDKNQDQDILNLINDMDKNLNINSKNKQKDDEYDDSILREQISKILSKLNSQQSTQIANSGAFFKLLSDQQQNELLNPNVVLAIVEKTKFNYCIQIFDIDSTKIYEKAITSELCYAIQNQENVLKWTDLVQNQIILYFIKFDSINAASIFNFVFGKCLIEYSNQQSFEEVVDSGEKESYRMQIEQNFDEEQDQYLYQQFQHDQDIEIEEEHSSVQNSQIYQDQNQQEDSEDEINNLQAQAKLLDRTFISKGNKISVYRTVDCGKHKFNLEYIASLPVVKTLQGDKFVPSKMQLHQQDTKVLLVNQSDNKSVYQLDLETGKIVDEYQMDGKSTITDIAPEKKHSQLTNNQLFLALNNKSVFLMDPRIQGKSQIAQSKVYKTDNMFSIMATNELGNIAIGSQSGDIRLYTDVGKIAKNLFRGWGDPIYGIDVTKDGKWVIATCKTYLILLPTFQDKFDGFQQTIKGQRPIPRKLTLNPNDIAKYQIQDLTFSVAKFDDFEKYQEKYIVTSVSNYIITWSMKQILKGEFFKYQIKQLNDKILHTEFKFNNDENLLITLPKEVCLQRTIKK